MILPNATLFPQAMLPLYIFEPRYRQMLRDALDTHRMFIVAMQKPGLVREKPSAVAGLGLIRASVQNKDGTSHLILQGLARVELAETIQYKPYRLQRIRPLRSLSLDAEAIDSLVDNLREVVKSRIDTGIDFHAPFLQHLLHNQESADFEKLSSQALQKFVDHLAEQGDAEQFADLISCALLSDPVQKQTLLETVDLEERLRLLICYFDEEYPDDTEE